MTVKSTGLLFEAKKMLVQILKSTDLYAFSCFIIYFCTGSSLPHSGFL